MWLLYMSHTACIMKINTQSGRIVVSFCSSVADDVLLSFCPSCPHPSMPFPPASCICFMKLIYNMLSYIMVHCTSAAETETYQLLKYA
jgi:hypothetical protein